MECTKPEEKNPERMLEDYLKDILPDLDTGKDRDRYGRFSGNPCKTDLKKFPKVIYYCTGSWQEEPNAQESEYSFDAEVLDDFKMNAVQAAAIAGTGADAGFLYCTLNEDKGCFTLASQLWLPTGLMPGIHNCLEFVENIDQNPPYVGDMGNRERFLESVKTLKNSGISLEQTYDALDKFRKQYTFSSFSLKEGCNLYYFQRDDKRETYIKDLWLKHPKMHVLRELFRRGIINLNLECIEELKKEARARYFDSCGVNEDETQDKLRLYAKEYSHMRSPDPVLSIEPDNFYESVKKLDDLGLLSRPGIFSIEGSHGYLMPAISEICRR